MPCLTATPTALLVELDRLGILPSIKADQISLRPGSQLPDKLLDEVCDLATELMALLSDPRRRWHEQAEAMIAASTDEDLEDLLHLFQEREAIASLDGGHSDDHAGQLAYEALKNHLQERMK